MNEQRLRELFFKYINDDCTSAEESELQWLVANPRLETALDALIGEAYDVLPEKFSMSELRADEIFSRVFENGDDVVPIKSSKKFFSVRRIAAAASVIVLLGAGTYFFFFNYKKTATINQPVAVSDIQAPSSNRATITLGSGRKIFLDSAANGKLAEQGHTTITKTANGVLAYQSSAKEASVVYNTLTNPRGSKAIMMSLSDGSRVWLNAESSVTYPVQFIGSERKISITGEAYFEVTHDAKKPFIVSRGDMNITVLGTHFNVNAYDDEKDIRVTLLEGSVKITAGRQQLLLSPNEQAQVTHNGNMHLDKSIDVEEVMAWKDGRFVFGEKTDINTIMRQVARWYDLDVEYHGTVDLHFGGSMSRQINVSKVLEKLEMTGSVKFKIEGRKIIVIP